MPLTYEQLAPALYKQARKLCDNRFQIHELVAECWLMGDIQELKSVEFASKRAYYDMVEYMRLETGIRNKHKLKLVSLQKRLYDDEFLLEDTISSKPDPGPEAIDTKDLFEKLCRGLNRQDALLLKLIYIENLEQVEAGIAIGVCESNVSKMLSNLLPRIGIILKNLGYDRENGPKTETDRTKRDRSFYNRTYWGKNSARIGERRKKIRQEARSRKRHALAV